MSVRTIVDNHGNEHDIIMWVMTGINWEYYVTEKEGEQAFGYVMGIENEWGSFTKSEIEEQGITAFAGAEDGKWDILEEVLPPEGWHWKETADVS